jgi:hypothetical protein
MLSFLSTAGYSPIAHPTSNVRPDGSFCSTPLGPGKYYLYFTRGSEAGLMSAVYYPGVSEQIKATTIEVSAGQTQSGITFRILVQKTYAVRSIISTDDKSGLEARSVHVTLVSLGGVPYPARYSQPIDFQSSFPLPKVKYFDFEKLTKSPIDALLVDVESAKNHFSEKLTYGELTFNSLSSRLFFWVVLPRFEAASFDYAVEEHRQT